MIRSVKEILDIKTSREVSTIDPEASVYEAVRLMADLNLGSLVVIDRGHLVGVITERDYARKIILQNRTSKATKVRDIMDTPVLAVTLDTTIDECMALMTARRVRHLPVVERGTLIGIVSIGDAVKSLIDEKNFHIEQLENYILGGYGRPREVQEARV